MINNFSQKILRVKFLENSNKTADIILNSAIDILEQYFGIDFILHLLLPNKDLAYDTLLPDENTIDVLGVFTGSERMYFGFTNKQHIIEKDIKIQDKTIRFKLYELSYFFKNLGELHDIDDVLVLGNNINNNYFINNIGISIMKVKSNFKKYLKLKRKLKNISVNYIKQYKNNDVNDKHLVAYKAFLYAYILFMIEDSDELVFPVIDANVLTMIKNNELSKSELDNGISFIDSQLSQFKFLDEEVKHDTTYQKIEETCISLMKDFFKEKLKYE